MAPGVPSGRQISYRVLKSNVPSDLVKKMKPKISVLVSARPDSKYLAKFLMGFYNYTSGKIAIEVLVMCSAKDTWNHDLFKMIGSINSWAKMATIPLEVKFYFEDRNMGRHGLHLYFGDLAREATGQWLIYFCDDHFFAMPSWDKYVYKALIDQLFDHNKIWCLVPKFDNAGAMNHILSRGYYETLGHLAQHGNLDSYINDIFKHFPERVYKFDDEMFHDFTHDPDVPQLHPPYEVAKAVRYDHPDVERALAADVAKIKKAIEEGK